MIDFEFIGKLEGFSLKGYVPNPETSRSGVTIASGFDIGQCSSNEVENAFPDNLSSKLLPYVGKIKQDACSVLDSQQLEVTEEEASLINAYAHNTASDRLVNEWRASDASMAFDELSVACQTVVASVAFQYGSLSRRTPNFWKQVTSGDWQGALKNLKNFGDKYATRRLQEAALLESWIEDSGVA